MSRVETIRRQLQAGTYRTDPQRIAAAIIDRALSAQGN
jgi:anti-sigma28 factor (negative regulator of flagellin synthesis)